MPSTRSLSGALNLARGTVLEAFEQLVAEGFLESKHGSGTRIIFAPDDHKIPHTPTKPAGGIPLNELAQGFARVAERIKSLSPVPFAVSVPVGDTAPDDIWRKLGILVLRADNSLLALYPDLHQLVYGSTAGEQTRVTFTRPSFEDTDYLTATLTDAAQQQLTRAGASTYQVNRDVQENVVIDILAGFSKAAAKTIVDYEAFALAQVTTINQALKNSRVEKTRVRLVGTQVIDQDQVITTSTLSSLSTLGSNNTVRI